MTRKLKPLTGAQKRKLKRDLREREENDEKELAMSVERLKLGPSELWEFVSDVGGVCQHLFEFEILTKLNENEIKFLNGTNTESRLAIKRAKIKLEDKFRIAQLSSISQLELAWANYQWGGKVKYSDVDEEYTKNQEEFCARVAQTNDLALLRWVREEKECDWDWETSGTAAYLGNLEMLKYCVENGCEVHERVCAAAASEGHLDCLQYLREKNCPWDERTVQIAHENNHVDILTYAVKNKAPGFERYERYIPK
jgi:hypothetical protein